MSLQNDILLLYDSFTDIKSLEKSLQEKTLLTPTKPKLQIIWNLVAAAGFTASLDTLPCSKYGRSNSNISTAHFNLKK